MKRKIILLFALIVIGTISASAQYTFNLQVKTNTGGNVEGTNQYLTINETTTQYGARTRTVTQTQTRTVRRYQTRTNTNNWNNITTTYSGDGEDGTGEWTFTGNQTTGTWSSYSWGDITESSSSLSFGASATSSSITGDPSVEDTTNADPYSFGTSTYTNNNSPSWVYPNGTSGYVRYRDGQTETRTATWIRTQEVARGITNAAVNWYFVPVPYTTNGTTTAEPGWYYIQNTMTGAYVVMTDAGPIATSTLPITDNGNGAKWRLIKVKSGDTADDMNMNFKLVSKLGFSTGGTLMYRTTANTDIVSGSTDYIAGNNNTVFLLNPTGVADNVIVRNDDQEIVSNYEAVSGTALEGTINSNPDDSNVVWLNTLPTPEINTTWNTTGGDINNGRPYEFAPICYLGSDGSTVIYGTYASGLEEGDGYYFTRMPNDNTMSQTLNNYTVTTTSSKLLFSVWLRGITSATLSSLTQVNGYYKVGTATFTYTQNQTTSIDLLVPANAINATASANDPSAWEFFTAEVDATSGSNTTNIVKEVTVTAAFGNGIIASLDVDNINLEVFSQATNASFIYKSSGSSNQARQDVPQFEHTLFVRQTSANQNIILTTATKSFYYYRWYKMTDGGRELYPTQMVGMYDTETATTTRNVTSGIVNFSAATNKAALTRGYRGNYTIPSTATTDFFDSDDAVVYCDMANYTDFTWTASSSTLVEPTVSLRNVFRIRSAEALAKEINTFLDKDSILEYYDIEAPIALTGARESRLRLTPKHDIVAPKSYWTYNNTSTDGSGTLYQSNTFTWRNITNVVNADYVNGTNNRFTTTTGTTTMTPLSDSKYLQINTTGKTHGAVEYYAVDVSNSNAATATRKRIAIFKVTYKQRDDSESGDIQVNGVGPQALTPASQDIFDHIEDKKLIIEKNFDQLGTYTPPLPNAFPNPQDNVTVYAMGVKPLASDETSYGFVNPLHFAGDGITSNGVGTHGQHRAPFWSEYGFPQQINGTTGNYSWQVSTVVRDITNLRAGGTNNDTMGNMMYIDAAELPGTFAALNFNESFCAGAKLYCSFWTVNLNTTSFSSADNTSSTYTRPNLVMILKTINSDGTETEIKRFYTGDIGSGDTQPTWYQVGFDFVIPSSLSGITADFRLEIRNNGLGTSGNDFAIDDIRVYRTNPAIKAVRTEDKFCLPDGNIIKLEPLVMKVEVDYNQLLLTTNETVAEPYIGNELYFRFLMPDQDPTDIESGNDIIYDNFPGIGDNGESMYVNNSNIKYDSDGNSAGTERYYYGKIELWKFTIPGTGEDTGKTYAYYNDSGDARYEGMYIYNNLSGKTVIAFDQTIPVAVLEMEEENYNTGQYAIYVAESSGALLTIECAGEASFNIDFDKTEFNLYVSGTEMESDGSLSACTNNTVDVKAFATAGASSEGEEGLMNLFAIYDWYYGPISTKGTVEGLDACDFTEGDLSNSAATFLRPATGSYYVGYEAKDYDGGIYLLQEEDILFDVLANAPVRNSSGFTSWLATEQGKCWLENDKDGTEWSWGEPIYVGYNMFGGRWRYTIPGYSYDTDEETGFPTGYPDSHEVIALDAITSATILGSSTYATDNKATNLAHWGYKPIDFRTVKADLETYRFFYPYEPELPTVDQTEWPINPHDTRYVESINYLTGKLTFVAPYTKETIPLDGRLTPDAYLNGGIYVADHAIHYVTNYQDKYITNLYGNRALVNDQKDPSSDGVLYVREYTSEEGIEGFERTKDDNWKAKFEFWDLNNLLARMHYYEGKGILHLYTDRIDAEIGSLATNYLSVIPTSQVAFNITNLNNPTAEQLNSADAIPICPTPSELSLKARSWAPDIWYGETNTNGRPTMPYFNIEDVYEDELDDDGNKVLLYEYMYTVRLPEQLLDGAKPTEQFVLPFLYFDEVKNARVKLIEVINEKGEQVQSLSDDDFAQALALEEVYLGLIDPNTGNKLLRNVEIPHTSYYENPLTSLYELEDGVSTEVERISPIDRGPQNFDVRWKITDRDENHALEAYPLVYNGYNYFIEENETQDEGDPFYIFFNHDVGLEGDPFPLDILSEAFGEEITSNKIGLEIMANTPQLREFVDVDEDDDTKYHFKAGYTYRFALETTGGKTWSTSDVHSCDLIMKFQLKVVPDKVIWGGTDKILSLEGDAEDIESNDYMSEWNRDGNWYIPTIVNGEYTNTASTNKTFPPLPVTKVVIPAGLGTNSTYATLDEYDNLQNNINDDAVDYLTDKKIISMAIEIAPYSAPEYVQQDIFDPTIVRTTPWIEFDYNYVPNSAHIIHFDHGGAKGANGVDIASAELARQDLLNYHQAEVDLTLNTLRWYGLSAPLKNLYTGDYMFEQANPLTEIRVHNIHSPQTHPNMTNDFYSDWSLPFNNTTIELAAGQGYSLSIGSAYYSGTIEKSGLTADQLLGSTNWEDRTSATFNFPETKNYFAFYNEITKELKEYYEVIDDDLEPITKDDGSGAGRKYRSRFIYEVPLDEDDEDEYGRAVITSIPNDPLVSIAVKTDGAIQGESTERYMVVGNPFMAHIDFNAFYKANKNLIEPEFKILQSAKVDEAAYGGESYITLSGIDDGNGNIGEPISAEGGLTLTSLPPMQTFIIKLKADVSTGNLVINRNMSVVNSNSILKAPAINDNLLQLSIRDQKGLSTNAAMKVSAGANDEYNPSEDSRRMLIKDATKTPSIFTIADGCYLDINRLGEVPASLPIGIVHGSEGKSTLTLTGFDSFDYGYDFYFIDTERGLKLLIEDDSFNYTFDYNGTESIGRFYLITEEVTGIKEVKNNLSVYAQYGKINVLSLNGSEIKDVSIYSTEGHLLYQTIDTGKSHITIPQPTQAPVVIVKASTDNSSIVTKVIIK